MQPLVLGSQVPFGTVWQPAGHNGVTSTHEISKHLLAAALH